MTKNKTILALGDVAALAIVTFIGFATHDETGLSFLPRMMITFIPLLIGWFLLAPGFGLFNSETYSDAKQLWRPVLVMVFAGTFAVVLRGIILNAPIIPIFGVVLSATSALGMAIWRGLAIFLSNRKIL